MFLKKLIKENQQLIDYSLAMHKSGKILPDTYIIDVDQVVENGRQILQSCGDDIKPYFMLKQLGRNPHIAKKLLEIGFSGAVAVDFKDVQVLIENKIPIKHIGHLVQLPKNYINTVLQYGVDYITVYSFEKAREINEVAQKLNINQKLFVKVYASKDTLYNGQYSGYHKEEVLKQVNRINELSNVTVVGLTTFPAFIYSNEKDDIIETENLLVLLEVKRLLDENGVAIEEINLPSSNCVQNIPLAKSLGATSIEPGHSLSGTTMLHEKHDLAEKNSYLYLTEVSHHFEEKSYVYGGGFYPRGNLSSALVSTDKIETQAFPNTPENIDYHLQIDGVHQIGEPVIMCFRTQIFVTRSDVALVEGLRSNTPRIVGVYDSQGRVKQ